MPFISDIDCFAILSFWSSQHRNGLMKIAEGGLLPEIARMPEDETERTGGDVRALETPALTSVHTVWLREHNRRVFAWGNWKCIFSLM